MAESVGIGAPITPTAGIDPRVNPNVAVTPAQNRGEDARPEADEEPTQLGLGTVVAAVVRQSAGEGPAAGAQLLLRIVAPTVAATALLTGTV
ncbi:MAG TPA: hypothetical protein VGF92_20250, partial [Stellaceae bacterium]